MENKRDPIESSSRRLLREILGTILPAAIGVGLFFVLPGDSRSQAERARAGGKPETAVLCGEWHRGSGETVALDLARVKRAYAGLKARLMQSLEAAKPEVSIDLKKPYDAGLPACREESRRTVSLPVEKGGRFRGRGIYVVSAPDPARLELPPEVEKDRGAEILVVRARSLADLPELAKRWGRPVGLGTAEFAKSLGVRCANTWVKFSEKGDALDVHESR